MVGGVLVGDASEYGNLVGLFRKRVNRRPSGVVRPGRVCWPAPRGGATAPGAGGGAQVCSCNSVSECYQISASAVRSQEVTTVAQVKGCTKAGTGLRVVRAAAQGCGSRGRGEVQCPV